MIAAYFLTRVLLGLFLSLIVVLWFVQLVRRALTRS